MEDIFVENPVLFLGRVEEIGGLPIAQDRTRIFTNSIRRVARLKIVEAFRGVEAARVEVSVYTGHSGGDCGAPFEEATTYLVAGKLVLLEGVYVLYADLCTTVEADGTPALLNTVRETVSRLPPLDQETKIGDRVMESGVPN